MRPDRSHGIERMVRVLNGDIRRELRVADVCLSRASHLPRDYYPVVHRQIAITAATALANATALAAEVLALGGIPAVPGPAQRRRLSAKAIESWQAQARQMLARYRRRLRMAEGFGLFRLREVLEHIVGTKERFLAQSGLIQAGDPAGRYLCS